MIEFWFTATPLSLYRIPYTLYDVKVIPALFSSSAFDSICGLSQEVSVPKGSEDSAEPKEPHGSHSAATATIIATLMHRKTLITINSNL